MVINAKSSLEISFDKEDDELKENFPPKNVISLQKSANFGIFSILYLFDYKTIRL